MMTPHCHFPMIKYPTDLNPLPTFIPLYKQQRHSTSLPFNILWKTQDIGWKTSSSSYYYYIILKRSQTFFWLVWLFAESLLENSFQRYLSSPDAERILWQDTEMWGRWWRYNTELIHPETKNILPWGTHSTTGNKTLLYYFSLVPDKARRCLNSWRSTPRKKQPPNNNTWNCEWDSYIYIGGTICSLSSSGNGTRRKRTPPPQSVPKNVSIRTT